MRKPFVTCLVFIILVASFAIAMSSQGAIPSSPYVWAFDKGEDLSGWGLFGGEFLQSDDGRLRFSFDATTRFSSPRNLAIDARKYGLLVLRLRITDTREWGYVGWVGGGGETVMDFITVPDGEFHNYYFDLRQVVYWRDVVNGLFFKPTRANGVTGRVEIDSIRLVEPSPYWDLVWAWDAYTTPQLYRGPSINFTLSPSALGTSINYLLYALAALVWLVLAGKALVCVRSLPQARSVLQRRLPAAVYLVLAVWLILEARSAYSQYANARYDFVRLAGKSMSEKHALFTGADFYQFLDFAKGYVPTYADYRLIVDDNYFAGKADYYLYPRRGVAAGKFILVYDSPDLLLDLHTGTLSRETPGGQPEIIATSVIPVAQFRDGVYVLRTL